MNEPTFGQKIAWFLYQKKLSVVAKPEFLSMVKLGDPKWFELAEILIKDNNLEGRDMILDQILQTRNLKNNPKRSQYMQMVLRFLAKGILDERRKIVKFVDNNSELFAQKDQIRDSLLAFLLTAQRDSDHSISNTAESAYNKLKGDEVNPMQMRDHRS